MPISRRAMVLQLHLGTLIGVLLPHRVACAETVSYTYDDLGRLKTVTYGNGQQITYTYDAAGNRTALQQTAPTPAPVGTLSASPTTIAPGASSTLSWTSANATSAVIDNGVGSVTPVAGGSVQVSPSTNTTYTLTLTGPGGSTTRQVSVTVTPGGTFSASPTSIIAGASSTLSWTSVNATSATIDNGVGPVTPASGGSVQVSPSATTTYTLTLTGTGGTITRQATVTVTPAGFTATIDLVSTTSGANLRSLANAAGYNGAQNATVAFEVESGVTVAGGAGTPNGGIAIDSGTWPTGSHTITLTLVVKSGGIVRGGGGGAGLGSSAIIAATAGGSGGDAVYCRLPISITVQSGGAIRAGGGGGGGGGTWSRMLSGEPTTWNGGGGGGAFPNGAGGLEGQNADNDVSNPGAAGTVSGGGAGGSGGSIGVGTRATGGGGAGGNAGAAGSAGAAPSGSGGSGSWTVHAGGAGGAAGFAVRKNGHTVTVTNNGQIDGAQG